MINEYGTKPFLVSTRTASSTNITTSYSELVESLSKEVHAIAPCYSGNAQIMIGIGPSSSEVDHVIITGGSSTPMKVPCFIPAGSRISIKTLTGTVSTGTFTFTFYY